MICRFCKTPVNHEFIDLVNSPASNSFLSKEELNHPEIFYPLKVQVCSNCFLVQVDEYKKSDNIFNSEYVYFSSYSTSWLAHAKHYVDMMTERFKLNGSSQIIEIASNDGYLLQYFVEKQIPVLGIEPTKNTAKVAQDKGVKTITEFFGVALAKKLVQDGVKADLLLGNNVLAHVPDIVDFVGGMQLALKAQGVITMEFPHLLKLIELNQFDTIYHEHFSYLSLYAVKQIFESQGLEIFDVEEIPTHGGSLRIFAKHKGNDALAVTRNVDKVLNNEIAKGINDLALYSTLQKNASTIKFDFLSFLIEQKKAGNVVAGYGAAAKGNTLLNFCGIKHDLISFVVDANPHKQNKFLPASHIPVVDESWIKKMKPKFVVIFPWNIKEEIVQQLSYINEWDGKFVIPIPNLHII